MLTPIAVTNVDFSPSWDWGTFLLSLHRIGKKKACFVARGAFKDEIHIQAEQKLAKLFYVLGQIVLSMIKVSN